MAKTTTFEHSGKIYEVRAIPTLNGWMVRIFVEGIPANRFTYSVDSEVYQDAATDGVPEDLVAGLMETAERDFRRGVARNWWPPKRLPTTISRRKSINSNRETVPLALLRDPKAQVDVAGVIAKPSRAVLLKFSHKLLSGH